MHSLIPFYGVSMYSLYPLRHVPEGKLRPLPEDTEKNGTKLLFGAYYAKRNGNV